MDCSFATTRRPLLLALRMQIGVLTLMTANPPLAIIFTWALILFHGHPTNRKRFPEVVRKQDIGQL